MVCIVLLTGLFKCFLFFISFIHLYSGYRSYPFSFSFFLELPSPSLIHILVVINNPVCGHWLGHEHEPNLRLTLPLSSPSTKSYLIGAGPQEPLHHARILTGLILYRWPKLLWVGACRHLPGHIQKSVFPTFLPLSPALPSILSAPSSSVAPNLRVVGAGTDDPENTAFRWWAQVLSL